MTFDGRSWVVGREACLLSGTPALAVRISRLEARIGTGRGSPLSLAGLGTGSPPRQVLSHVPTQDMVRVPPAIVRKIRACGLDDGVCGLFPEPLSPNRPAAFWFVAGE